MDWKTITKPLAKWALKFGLNYGLDYAATKVAAYPEKGEQIVGDVAKLSALISADAEAIKDGKYDEEEKAVSDAKVEVFVDSLFNY